MGKKSRTKTARPITVQTAKDKQRLEIDQQKLPGRNIVDRLEQYISHETMDKAAPQIIITPPGEWMNANPRLTRKPRHPRHARHPTRETSHPGTIPTNIDVATEDPLQNTERRTHSLSPTNGRVTPPMPCQTEPTTTNM